MEYIFSKLKGDKWIWIIVILLSIWSLLAVYSSVGTLAYKEGKGTELYLLSTFYCGRWFRIDVLVAQIGLPLLCGHLQIIDVNHHSIAVVYPIVW